MLVMLIRYDRNLQIKPIYIEKYKIIYTLS